MSDAKADTVPGLGFKDKEKALETIKNLEGRDPDYQKLAIKGLIGRAKRTLTLTKDKEKLQNINDAMSTFEEWLKNFELSNASKENRAYLPLASIEALLPLKDKFEIVNTKVDQFLKAYRKAKADYKFLRTVSSGENEPTWDIETKPDLWKDDLPTKEHMEIILWAYSPDASKIKKNISTYEDKLGSVQSIDDDEDDLKDGSEEKDEEEDKPENNISKEERKERKRKSSEDSSEDDESPKKKNKN
ncbi:hypothetical protein NQ317_018880 [Molorchus minor]|uniref:Uncharacterized protein n=1 Tax=Molorchus minor TaxID=1323400 RepID=A0ABQ9IS34_9CUCU|nr:hypothetical protein NQ317_018880 [Molorchus minor]